MRLCLKYNIFLSLNDPHGVESSPSFLLTDSQVFISSDLRLAGEGKHVQCVHVCVTHRKSIGITCKEECLPDHSVPRGDPGET